MIVLISKNPAQTPATRKIRTFDELIRQYNGKVTVACDTEFKGPHTLTMQFTARLGEDIVVQVYSSPAIPYQPDPDSLAALLSPQIQDSCREVIIREGRAIHADLAPGHILADLFGLRGVEAFPRMGEEGEVDGELTITLVGHTWKADFFRVFGREFFETLVKHQVRGGRLAVVDHKLLAFKEGVQRWRGPVLGYAWQNGDVYSCQPDGELRWQSGSLYALRVSYFDTCLCFGHASLDELARTFVGVGKTEGFDEGRKADMLTLQRYGERTGGQR